MRGSCGFVRIHSDADVARILLHYLIFNTDFTFPFRGNSEPIIIIYQNATDANVPLAIAPGYPDTATGFLLCRTSLYVCYVCPLIEAVVARGVVVVLLGG